MREEVLPKNILMMGPTGVGKTEIARRLAKLAQAPFLKVEATKFTEVGYVGRDVEQIVRDLVEIAIHMTRERLRKEVTAQAEMATPRSGCSTPWSARMPARTPARSSARCCARAWPTRRSRSRSASHRRPARMPTIDIPGMPGAQMGMINLNDMLGKAFGPRTTTKRMSVADSYVVLIAEESDKLLDEDGPGLQEALEAVEQNGIVFPRRNRQDHRALRPLWRPTSAAKACSAICCR